MADIRAFCGTDVPEIIEIWNKAMPYNKVTKKEFIKNFVLDHNFDKNGFLIAEENGEVAGFIYALVRSFPADKGAVTCEDLGYINAIGIKDEKNVLGGLGKKLIGAAENYIRSLGKSKIKVSKYTPHYIYQGINTEYKDYISLFFECGYEKLANSFSRSINLDAYERPSEIDEIKVQRESEGFTFCDMKDEYIIPLFEYSSPGWNHRFRRLLLETMDYEKFSLAVYKGKVVGVAIFGDTYSCEERFGPYSVSDDMRGLGLGKILLHECFAKMKNRGLREAWAQSTPTEGAAAYVYDKIGFRKKAEYFIFEKNI